MKTKDIYYQQLVSMLDTTVTKLNLAVNYADFRDIRTFCLCRALAAMDYALACNLISFIEYRLLFNYYDYISNAMYGSVIAFGVCNDR